MVYKRYLRNYKQEMEARMKTICPKCGQHYEVDVPEEYQCVMCSFRFKVLMPMDCLHLEDSEVQRVFQLYSENEIYEADARELLWKRLDVLGIRIGSDGFDDIDELTTLLDTQRQMATSVARLQARDADELEDWPAWRLERYGSRRAPREDWAARWHAAGQSVGWQGASKRHMVALKTSPIWQALGDGAGGFKDTLGNPYPPFAYGSGMDWTDVDAEEAARYGLEPDGLLPKVSLSPSDQEVARAIVHSGHLDRFGVG